MYSFSVAQDQLPVFTRIYPHALKNARIQPEEKICKIWDAFDLDINSMVEKQKFPPLDLHFQTVL